MPQLHETRQEFLQSLKKNQRADATVVAYSKDIEQLIDFVGAKQKLLPGEVVREDLDGFLEKLSGENYTPKSISRKINAIRTFFKFLKASGYVDEDPSSSLTHPKIELKPPRILSSLEYRALRDAARNDIRTAAIVELLLQTGIRIGELRRLQVIDATFSEDEKPGELRVAAAGKTPERTVPLNKTVEESLKRYLAVRPGGKDETFFITKTGRPLMIRNIRTTINRGFKTAGVEKARVNDLRHTFVATHLARGVSLTTVSRLAGHRRLITTEKYLAYVKAPAQEKVELLEL